MRKKRQFLWIVLLSLALLCGCSDATNNNDDTGLVIEETQEPVITEVPTLTSEPTATPAPTATPEPTATPAPTATPEPTPEPYVEDINVYGNTAGNIYNGGLLCEDEDNYYIYFYYYDCVYRTDKITGESTILGNGQLMEMNVFEGKLYGSRVGLVSGLCAVDTATGEETLVREGDVYGTLLVDKEIYFIEGSAESLRKLNLETGEELCLVEEGVQTPVVYKDKVYFVNQADNGCIYSISREGGEAEKLNDTASFLPLVYKDRIYYMNTQGDTTPIYSMKVDGSDVQLLEGTDAGFFNIYEGVLYYIDRADASQIYCMDLEAQTPVFELFDLEPRVRAGISEHSTTSFSEYEAIEFVGLNFQGNHLLFLCTNLIDGGYYTDEFLYDFETDKVVPLGYFCYEVPSFTVEEMSKVMYAQSAVNVRIGPSTDYEKVGSLTTNQQVQVTGLTSTGWYRIDLNGQEAYVSQKYLGDAQVVVEPSQNEQPSQGGSTPGRSYPPGDYGKGTVYGPKLNQTERDQVADAVQAYLNSYDFASMSEYDKVATAHDYLCNICSYAADWSKNRANTAWGALVYGEAQCSGYARAMKALCDAMGVGCYYVHADDYASNPSHQWNTVCIDGNWYIIDVQGNDSSGGKYFYLLSDDTYVYMSGMSWDRSSVPACPKDYFQ
ncbi:MAG: DUF5050 domain-containing protein [Lachnospiraceae bacterium]|nr:DUF5050 domain-containing protein [Lachnospiraceae bacterium]